MLASTPPHLRPILAGVFLASVLLAFGERAAAQPAGYVPAMRANYAITEGAFDLLPDGWLKVATPRFRATVILPARQMAELQFRYLGPTAERVALASGEVREQLGLKLNAQDSCNLVYVMWRLAPTPGVTVQVKRNADASTSAVCEDRGYETVRPAWSGPPPSVSVGDSHSLRAEMEQYTLRTYADGQLVWEGPLGTDLLEFAGPVGVRTDNTHIDMSLYLLLR